jgi:N-acetyltransferase
MAFGLQPTLRGELIELRPLRADDFDDLYAVASDPLIWEQHPAQDRYKGEVFSELFRESLDSGGALVAIDRATGKIIGSSRYHAYSAEASEVEIGWSFLAREYWGGKYNGEMKRLMLRHAFQYVKRVMFLIGPQNVRSQKAIEKLGAVRIANRLDSAGREAFVFELTSAPD